jgi:DNA repair protein RecN (Recombination protein N)
MLTELHIENLGVIAAADFLLSSGLTALTGETGAGKTMLVEAINLLIGGRADIGLIRPGSDQARVEGRFVTVVDGEESEIVVARVVPADGRSRTYVNGRLATVATLAEMGASMLELHGQHAHQSLLTATAQRHALDRFGHVDLGPLGEARRRLTDVEAALATLGGDAKSRAREVDLLRYQVDELACAELVDADEDASLEAEEDLLAGAVAHRQAAQRALAALQDDDAAIDSLAAALGALGHRSPFTESVVRLRSISVELLDATSELSVLTDSIEEDPARLEAIRQRRQLLRELCRKYGDSLAEVIEFHRAATTRLEELHGYEQRAAQLEAQRHEIRAAVSAAAAAVGAARRRAAPKLASAVRAHLVELAMGGARIEVHVGDDPGDEVTFMLGANIGEPLAALSKVASGGELSRLMLALRLVLTEAPDTLVFDEVDAGIGGSAAVAVAAALSKLGQRHQVLVVTHLAQVAAVADHQLVVSKHERGGRTVTSVRVVGGAERTAEVSRMLSGSSDSEAALRHAEELLLPSSRN